MPFRRSRPSPRPRALEPHVRPERSLPQVPMHEKPQADSPASAPSAHVCVRRGARTSSHMPLSGAPASALSTSPRGEPTCSPSPENAHTKGKRVRCPALRTTPCHSMESSARSSTHRAGVLMRGQLPSRRLRRRAFSLRIGPATTVRGCHECAFPFLFSRNCHIRNTGKKLSS